MDEEPQDDHHDPPPKPIKDHHSNIDTSRAFSSVKEAVAIFGKRILPPANCHNINTNLNKSPEVLKPKFTRVASSSSSSSPPKPLPIIASSPQDTREEETKPNKSPEVIKPNFNQVVSSSPSSSPPKPLPIITSSPHQNTREEDFLKVLKTLEAELKETKTELRQLKERESETEVALASLNAELHKNMSKIARAEADAAGKSVTAAKTVTFETKEREHTGGVSKGEEMRKEWMKRMESEYPTLAQILDGNSTNFEEYFGKNEKTKPATKKKKKPIVPLVGDFFFFKKKAFSGEISGPLFTGSSSIRI